MKKRWIIGMMLSVGLLSGCAGEKEQNLTETPQETTAVNQESITEVENTDSLDYEAIYEPALSENLDLIEYGYDDEKDYKYVSSGMIEKVMYEEKELLLQEVGCVIEDISGDGIPELLIGADGVYNTDQDASGVFSVFTYKDGEVVTVIEGWARNVFLYLGGGRFYTIGSGGAMYTGFGELHLSADGSEIIWDDYYFTSDKEGEDDIFYFHNTTGDFNVDASEELEISMDEFFDVMLNYKFELLPWKPLGTCRE